MEVTMIDASKIDAEDHSQRFEMPEEKIVKLANSIRDDGLLQPIGVKANGERFTVVFGHCRLEACKRVGHNPIECIIKTGDEVSQRRATFVENIFTTQLTPVELACAIAEEVKEKRMSIEQIAFGCGRTTDWVRKQLAITQWPPEILEAMHQEKISTGAAANLAQITDDKYRKIVVRQAVENGVTARTTAAWLQAWRAAIPPEEAIETEPVAEENHVQPLVPQAPCSGCLVTQPQDRLGYFMICPECHQVLTRMQQHA